MLLAFDIGNTNIVLGCIRDSEILFSDRISTDRSRTMLEYAIMIRDVLHMNGLDVEDITGTIVASVVPPVTNLVRDALERITGEQPMIVGPGIKTGLNIMMDDPAQVGADLIVGAVAGITLYECPLILIDMGTATTITVIDENRNYTGGMILPGLQVSLDSLTSRTSKLPGIGLDPPRRLIGKNTIECMKSGILYGNAACLDGMIDRIEAEIGKEACVVATGGLAGTVAKLCRHRIILDDELLLKGLWLLYKKNR